MPAFDGTGRIVNFSDPAAIDPARVDAAIALTDIREVFNAVKLSRHRHVATDTTTGHVLPSPTQRR